MPPVRAILRSGYPPRTLVSRAGTQQALRGLAGASFFPLRARTWMGRVAQAKKDRARNMARAAVKSDLGHGPKLEGDLNLRRGSSSGNLGVMVTDEGDWAEQLAHDLEPPHFWMPLVIVRNLPQVATVPDLALDDCLAVARRSYSSSPLRIILGRRGSHVQLLRLRSRSALPRLHVQLRSLSRVCPAWALAVSLPLLICPTSPCISHTPMNIFCI